MLAGQESNGRTWGRDHPELESDLNPPNRLNGSEICITSTEFQKLTLNNWRVWNCCLAEPQSNKDEEVNPIMNWSIKEFPHYIVSWLAPLICYKILNCDGNQLYRCGNKRKQGKFKSFPSLTELIAMTYIKYPSCLSSTPSYRTVSSGVYLTWKPIIACPWKENWACCRDKQRQW